MSTMQKIADAIGVSKATVSRALNETGYVSPDTRKRILKAAEALGYRPNLLAKNLSTRQSKCVGLVVANEMLSGHYAHEIVEFCAQKLQEQGMELLLADGKNSAEGEQAAIALLSGLQCDAILLYSHFLSTDDLDTLIIRAGIPIMVINRILEHHPAHAVCCNHHQDARQVTHHLLDRGYRQIGAITGKLNSPTARMRLQGIRDALEERGHALLPSYTTEGDWRLAGGYQAMKQLLTQMPDTDAVIVANDEMAIGAMRYLAEHGITIPDDIALVGFDDIPAAAFLTPSLSSVRAPTKAMLEGAISQLLAMTHGLQPEPQPLFASNLTLRESVGHKTQA